MIETAGKVAVVLFNLGGPDSLAAVKPFLRNLFSDPAIIGAPAPLRWLLARFISGRRAPVARGIYEKIGGRSPILPLTEQQAESLRLRLQDHGLNAQVFVCMRYWHPMSDQVAASVKAYEPDRIVLLPLYPQFSTTTSGSSFKDWSRAAGRVGLTMPTHTVCCYPEDEGWVAAQASVITKAIDQSGVSGRPRILFSAHGLPKKIVDSGDPYSWQVERTVKAVVGAMARDDLDFRVCYQSRVGPLEWIGPATEDEIHKAGEDGVPVVIVPIAFVSEHSETLVELDMEYGELAEQAGVPSYVRVPAVGCHDAFIDGLATRVWSALAQPPGVRSANGQRICPASWTRCGYVSPSDGS